MGTLAVIWALFLAFIGTAPEDLVKILLALVWAVFFLFIAGEIIWMLGRELISLL